MKFGWKGALGLVVTAVCLYFAFRNTDWAAARRAGARTRTTSCCCSRARSRRRECFRCARFAGERSSIPSCRSLPFGPLWRSIAIGMMVNNVALLRAGEFARVFALTREVPAVTFSTAFASLVVDRVFDAIVVLLLLAVSMLAPGFSGHDADRRLFAVAPRVRLCGWCRS